MIKKSHSNLEFSDLNFKRAYKNWLKELLFELGSPNPNLHVQVIKISQVIYMGKGSFSY